jgi:glycosidase
MTPIESMKRGNDIRKYKMAMTVLATMRGIPQLYYGSEIGMAGIRTRRCSYSSRFSRRLGWR